MVTGPGAPSPHEAGATKHLTEMVEAIKMQLVVSNKSQLVRARALHHTSHTSCISPHYLG